MRGRALHVEVLPEVKFARLGIVMRKSLVPSVRTLPWDDVGAIDDAQGLADVVVGDDNADAAVLRREDDLLHVGDRDRIDAGERFARSRNLGCDKRASDFESSVAAGEG